MLSEKIVNFLGSKEPQFLMEYEGAELIKQFGLPVAPSTLALDVEEAKAFSKDIGYPIVLKGMSRDIIHKTEAGIVKINIKNEEELEEAFVEILENARKYKNNVSIEGILVQKMAEKGIELIFGIKKDSIFGYQLVIGFGGILVEVMKDFAMRMMPVSIDDINEMISELKSYPILKGYRGNKGIDMETVTSICLKLNHLIENHPNIEELDLNPVIFTETETLICDVRILMVENDAIEISQLSLESVEKMINPKSIAVIGASQNEKKNGGRLFRYLVENKFPGNLYPINLDATEIKGYKAFAKLINVPGDIDLACIIVSSNQVVEAMKECVEKRVKAVIIYSSGFAEIGEDGKNLQDEVLEIARQGQIRVLGPNSIGIASPQKNIYTAFGAALESKVKPYGDIGFVSQSGAIGSALLSRAWEQGVGFSRWISVANEIDLTTSDFIEILAEDELTKVIAVFMEGIKEFDSFKRASIKALNNKKPLLIYKTGVSSVGKKAVQSHTGSMAGDDIVYSTAFKKYGALRLENIEDLIDVSRAFSIQPLPKGNNIGIITASGGACSVLADRCSERGLMLPELKETLDVIKGMIPSFGSAQNPIDVTAEIIAKPQMFKDVLEAVVQAPEIDGIIIMLTTNADPGALIIAESIINVFKKQSKPIVLGRLGADHIAPQAMAYYQQENFPVYSTPERVVNVMSYLVRYGQIINAK